MQIRLSQEEAQLLCTAVMQLNSEQMETRVLQKRTCDRTANLNPYFLKYFRSNHDATVLVDAGHKMRYVQG